MILFINGIIDGVQVNHLGYPISNYESAFELLTQLVANDWIIQEAVVTDGLDRLKVPVEVFDGQPIQCHINSLQRQWQELLADQPTTPDRQDDQELSDWYLRLEAYYTELTAHLEKTISFAQKWKDRLTTYPDKSLCFQFQKHYNTLLTSNQRMLDQTNKSRQLTSNRLKKLKKGL